MNVAGLLIIIGLSGFTDDPVTNKILVYFTCVLFIILLFYSIVIEKVNDYHRDMYFCYITDMSNEYPRIHCVSSLPVNIGRRLFY